jgi:hypothetical protein
MKLEAIYFKELAFRCTEIKEECEEVFAVAVPSEETPFTILHAVHSSLGLVLTSAANVKKLLDDKRPRDKRFESEDSYKQRLARAKMLQTEIDGIDITEMLDVQVRNTLEHFDEYLDTESVRLSHETVPSGVVFNVGMLDRNRININGDPPLHIRTYEIGTRKLIHLRGEIDIGKIYDSAVAILKRLLENGRIDEKGSTGVISLLNFKK